MVKKEINLQGALGPARAPGTVAWWEGGQRAVLGPRGVLGLPRPRSLTPDAPGGATWPGGSGTTPRSSKRGPPMSEAAGGRQARPLSLPGFPSPSGFCLLSDLIPTPCDANMHCYLPRGDGCSESKILASCPPLDQSQSLLSPGSPCLSLCSGPLRLLSLLPGLPWPSA